jgi:hypothetical protein
MLRAHANTRSSGALPHLGWGVEGSGSGKLVRFKAESCHAISMAHRVLNCAVVGLHLLEMFIASSHNREGFVVPLLPPEACQGLPIHRCCDLASGEEASARRCFGCKAGIHNLSLIVDTMRFGAARPATSIRVKVSPSHKNPGEMPLVSGLTIRLRQNIAPPSTGGTKARRAGLTSSGSKASCGVLARPKSRRSAT